MGFYRFLNKGMSMLTRKVGEHEQEIIAGSDYVEITAHEE
jgi:hypothetical protein